MTDRELTPDSLFMWSPGCSAHFAKACPSLNGFLKGTLGSTPHGGDLTGWGRTSELVLRRVCVASALMLSIPSILRPAVWDTPEASTLVRYSNGGCPWCVHFIYDEYYMANLLSVLNSSWESLTRGSSRQRLCRVRNWIVYLMISACFGMCVTQPGSPRKDPDLGETVVF